MKKEVKDQGVRVRNTPAFKLKDRPNRQFQVINLKAQFGFIPETIVIEKVSRYNNAFIVRAVMTKEAIAEEEKQLKISQKT